MTKVPEQTYEWHFLTRYPPTFLDKPFSIELFREWVAQYAGADGEFPQKLRRTALAAIATGDPKLIRQALQCLAHVGTPDDVASLSGLLDNADPLIARDTKTCIFEIRDRPAKPD